MKMFQYTCVGCPNLDELNYIIDHAKEITYSTFKKHVDNEYIINFNERVGIPINKDWAVSFYKSKTEEGKTVYYFEYSAIEHVFY